MTLWNFSIVYIKISIGTDCFVTFKGRIDTVNEFLNGGLEGYLEKVNVLLFYSFAGNTPTSEAAVKKNNSLKLFQMKVPKNTMIISRFPVKLKGETANRYVIAERSFSFCNISLIGNRASLF